MRTNATQRLARRARLVGPQRSFHALAEADVLLGRLPSTAAARFSAAHGTRAKLRGMNCSALSRTPCRLRIASIAAGLALVRLREAQEVHAPQHEAIEEPFEVVVRQSRGKARERGAARFVRVAHARARALGEQRVRRALRRRCRSQARHLLRAGSVRASARRMHGWSECVTRPAFPALARTARGRGRDRRLRACAELRQVPSASVASSATHHAPRRSNRRRCISAAAAFV